MTDFEKQVAQALSDWVANDPYSNLGGPVDATDPFQTWIECQVRELAPRVAAAIQAATHVRSKPNWPMGIHTPDTQAMAEAALAALRSGETPQP